MGLLAATIVFVMLCATGRLVALTIRAIAVLLRVLLALVVTYVAQTFVLVYLARDAVTS